MVKNALKAVGTLLTAVVLATGFSSSASAANRVDCAGRTDFVTLIAPTGVEYCFANAGTLHLSVLTHEIKSGNNRVVVTFHDGEVWRLDQKYLHAHIHGTVVRLDIY
ncbi:beta/gamma crystallin domain-containing protein [Streptomyces sp. NPDC004976]